MTEYVILNVPCLQGTRHAGFAMCCAVELINAALSDDDVIPIYWNDRAIVAVARPGEDVGIITYRINEQIKTIDIILGL